MAGKHDGRDCAGPVVRYMLAEASIVLANIAPAGIMVMRPYYKPGNYTMGNSVGYLMRMAINRVTRRAPVQTAEPVWVRLFPVRGSDSAQTTDLARTPDPRAAGLPPT